MTEREKKKLERKAKEYENNEINKAIGEYRKIEKELWSRIITMENFRSNLRFALDVPAIGKYDFFVIGDDGQKIKYKSFQMKENLLIEIDI